MSLARQIRVASLLGILTLVGCGHSPVEIIKGPYLQNVTATSITIMWETNRPAISKVSYRQLNQPLHQLLNPSRAKIHEVTLTDLEPETRYEYEVASGLVSARSWFRTAVAPNTPFRFAVYGDSRSHPGTHRSISRQMLLADPAFILNTGDLVDSGNRPKDWEKQFFEPLKDVIDHIPFYPTLGNHEDHAALYYNFFSLPTDETTENKAKQSDEESWYAFDYGSARFIALDSDREASEYQPGSAQYEWLERQLGNHSQRWTFVYFHHPPYSSGKHGSSIGIRNAWSELFMKHGVDLVFSGHDHIYERTYPIRKMLAEDNTPVTYIVTGGGGAGLHSIYPQVWTAHSASANHFMLIEIDNEQLDLVAYTDDAEVLDTLTIRKQAGKPVYDSKNIAYEQIELENHLSDQIRSLYFDTYDEKEKEREIAIPISNPLMIPVEISVLWELDSQSGWNITPSSASHRLKAEEQRSFTFHIRTENLLRQPAPTFRIHYRMPFGEGEVSSGPIRIGTHRRFACRPFQETIHLYGNLAENAWMSAAKTNHPFTRADGQEVTDFPTIVRTMRDSDAFYFGFELEDAQPERVFARSSNTVDLGGDDAAGIYLSPPERDDVYLFAFNARKARHATRNGTYWPEANWSLGVQKDDVGWTAEVRIPFTLFRRMPRKGERWWVNFFRNTRIREFSEWNMGFVPTMNASQLGILEIQ